MNRRLKMMLVLMALVCAGYAGMAQAVAPITPMASLVKKMQAEVERTESNGDVVDDVLYDYIFRDQSMNCNYIYQLFKDQDYTLHVVGNDGGGSSKFVIRIYKQVGSDWITQVTSQTNFGTTADLDFSPKETARYKIEITCELGTGYQNDCFGLLIIRKE
jgi:hypothetical protein